MRRKLAMLVLVGAILATAQALGGSTGRSNVAACSPESCPNGPCSVEACPVEACSPEACPMPCASGATAAAVTP